MKKVLYISNRTAFSGGEVVLLRLIQNNPDVTPIVATPRGELANRLKDLNIPTHILSSISQLDRSKNKFWPLQAVKNYLRSQVALIKIIKKEKPNIIHANALGAAIYSFLPSFLTGTPFVWTSHNIYPAGSLNTLAVRLVGLFSHQVVTVSRAVQKNLISSGVPKNKTVVIYNGLDLPTLIHKKDNVLLNKFHQPSNTKVIALIAALTSRKGQHLLIDAAAELLPQFPNTSFFLIGAVEDPNYADSLQQKVKDLRLSDHIFLTGFQKNITDLYPDIDILVNASVNPEPFGTTIYEAMSAGKIAVASNLGGSPEIIEDQKTGFLFQPGSSTDLANKLSFILQEFDTLDHVRKNARQAVAERFNIKVMVESHNRLYENL